MSSAPTTVTLVLPKPTPPDWTPTTDLRKFVRQFNRYLTLSGIRSDNHALRLEYLSVALPTDLIDLLEIEMAADPHGTFTDVTERFLLKAGSPPKDPAAEQAAFDAATIHPDETMAQFSGRLTLMAAAAFSHIPSDIVDNMIVNRFINSLAKTHPTVYRMVLTQDPKTLADAVKAATAQVRMEAVIAKETPPVTTSLPASASTSVQSNVATAALSDTALTEKIIDVLGHLRVVRSTPNRNGPNQARGFRRLPPRFRQNRNNYYDDNAPARQQPFNRPGTAPPPHIQCFNCGENHFVRNCPKDQWPGQR